jgi:glycerol-3-phosphate dehydrogenase (NAD+)
VSFLIDKNKSIISLNLCHFHLMSPVIAEHKEKVCLIGSGNWGSAIANIVGRNVEQYPDQFELEVKMWVFEEIIDGQKLSSSHENVKYLPGIKLPSNIKAIPSLEETVEDATVLVFVIPHQFVKSTCNKIQGRLRSNVKAISLIKGVDVEKTGGLTLISEIIRENLNVDVSVLMGANIASEVAKGQFCETTIGYRNRENGELMKKIFHRPHQFKVNIIEDVISVELCGALKNVVGVAAGLVVISIINY